MTWRHLTAIVLLGVLMSPAAERIRRWRASTALFAAENFGFQPDPWQREAFEAFDSPDPAKQRISLQACVGPGKSAVLAICGWKFLSCYGGRNAHPKGVAVSVTGDNLKDNLWSELAVWRGRSEYLKTAFTWTKERIFANDHPETWFLAARSWSKSASTEEQGKTLAGLHGPYVLGLIDESGTIPPAIGRAAEQALSTNPIFGKLIQAGNPSSLDGLLYYAAVSGQWYVIRITGDPDDPNAWVHSPRVARSVNGSPTPAEWARTQINAYGRENPWVMSSILGMFPPASLNALLGPEEVQAAMARTLDASVYSWAQKRLGIDVARYGDDRTVIFPRQGLRAFTPTVMRHARGSAVSTDIATAVMVLRESLKTDVDILDATGGWAAGASDVLKSSGRRPVEVQFHAPSGNDKYKNRRAEMWFGMAEWVKAGGWLPNVPELVAELTAPTYMFLNGKMQLEPKEQVKERIGRSPDLADALALTFAVPETRFVTPTPPRPPVSTGSWKTR